jgi:hypothetical protein
LCRFFSGHTRKCRNGKEDQNQDRSKAAPHQQSLFLDPSILPEIIPVLFMLCRTGPFRVITGRCYPKSLLNKMGL